MWRRKTPGCGRRPQEPRKSNPVILPLAQIRGRGRKEEVGSTARYLPPISPRVYALNVRTIPHSSRMPSKTMNTGVGVLAAPCW